GGGGRRGGGAARGGGGGAGGRRGGGGGGRGGVVGGAPTRRDDYNALMATEEPRDRQAYLEEQIARQKRGEPIDVEWAKSELARTQAEVSKMRAASRRNLRLLIGLCAALLLVMWVKRGGFEGPAGIWTFGLILIGALVAWTISNRRR